REQESSDEPYVLICVVDLTRKLNIPGQSAVIVPNVNTLRTGPFATSVDTGQTVAVKPLVPCWGFGGHPAVVQTPDDLIILVAMMEHDDTSVDAVQSVVNTFLTPSAYGHANGMTHSQLVTQLRADMKAAISTANLSQPFNSDEQIGQITELRLT